MLDLTRVAWRKSSRSGASVNNCVEVARVEDWAAVRDSKNAAGTTLVLAAESFAMFVNSLRAREL